MLVYFMGTVAFCAATVALVITYQEVRDSSFACFVMRLLGRCFDGYPMGLGIRYAWSIGEYTYQFVSTSS